MVKRDLSDLPAGPPPEEPERVALGERVAQPLFAQAVEAWFEDLDQTERPRAVEGTAWRASMASVRCDRAAWYQLRGVPKTEPPSIADEWRMNNGQLVHDVLDRYQDRVFPEVHGQSRVHNEVTFDLAPFGLSGSGHCDFVHYWDAPEGGLHCEAVEVKTVGGFKFKTATSRFKGPPEGPGYDHWAQAALAGLAFDAQRIRIVYIAFENIGADLVRRWNLAEVDRFLAEWTMERDQFLPIAQAELVRARLLVDLASMEPGSPTDVPMRMLDLAGRRVLVSDPRKGSWVQTDGPNQELVHDAGTSWHCDYCRFRTQCLSDGA